MSNLNLEKSIKNLLEAKKMSLKELADKTETSPQNLNRILKADSITTRHLQKLADALEVPITYFFDNNINTDIEKFKRMEVLVECFKSVLFNPDYYNFVIKLVIYNLLTRFFETKQSEIKLFIKENADQLNIDDFIKNHIRLRGDNIDEMDIDKKILFINKRLGGYSLLNLIENNSSENEEFKKYTSNFRKKATDYIFQVDEVKVMLEFNYFESKDIAFFISEEMREAELNKDLRVTTTAVFTKRSPPRE